MRSLCRCDGRETNADGDEPALGKSMWFVELGDRGAYPVGDGASAGDVGAGQDDGELLASVSGYEVDVTNVASERVGDEA